jgi:hypothetical protein
MTTREDGFRSTKHAKEQFVARFPNVAKNADNTTLLRLFYDAKEMPHVFNNTSFVVYHMERYKNFDTRYFASGDMVFVADVKAKVIFTVLDRSREDAFRTFRDHDRSSYRK